MNRFLMLRAAAGPRSKHAQPRQRPSRGRGVGECAALLYHDFASFAARAFCELNPRTQFAVNWHVELIAAKLAGAVHAGDPAADHQPAAAPSEVAPGLGRLSGLVASATSRARKSVRQLRPGPRRQIVARLPADPRQRLVPAAFATASHPAIRRCQSSRRRRRARASATSVGGVLTGRGADIIVIDDPLKPEKRCLRPSARAATNGTTTPSTAAQRQSSEGRSC